MLHVHFFYSLINYSIFEVDEPPAADILCQVERQTVQQVTYDFDDWP